MKILIIGATSAIAQAVGQKYAKECAEFYLMARNGEKLQEVAEDLKVRGGKILQTAQLDANAQNRSAVISEALQSGPFDVALIAHGVLPDQVECEQNPAAATAAMDTNFTSAVAIVTQISNDMKAKRRGTLAVISSVAGDRGRPSNYVYGAAKAGLTAFLEGLRGKLKPHNVHVLTIKPGFVDTPMTAHIQKRTFFATPDKVAADIHRAIRKRKSTLYTPWFWKWIMCVVKMVPESVVRRMKS